jgi:outer membrane protein assembly factor BamB
MKKITVMLMACCVALGAIADDWPQWRGPEGTGISAEKTWNPKAVSAGKQLWKKNIGTGYSGVSVVKERVFAVGNSGGNDIIVCLNAADGSQLWKYAYKCGSPKRYPGPRGTPAVDVASGLVYVLSREGELYCINAANGREKWKQNLKDKFGAEAPKWAFSSSPRVVGDTLLINGGANCIALNKKTGAKIWSGGPGAGGYSSPVVYTQGGKQFVAVFAAKKAYGLDLKTGAEKWSYPWETAYNVNAADPIVIGNEVFLSSGYNKGCVMLDISGKPKSIWQSKVLRSHFSGLIEDKGVLYGIDGQSGNKKADLKCVDFKTGTQKWSEKTGFGSILGADGKIIFLGEKGKLTVSEMTAAGYKEIATTKLELSGKCWTMPVLAYGRIYCRSEGGDLICVDVRK